MKIKVIETKDVRYVQVDVAVRYQDEDMPFDAPKRVGNMWRVIIDLEEKKILKWPKGKILSFYMKICDEGIYTLLDLDFNTIKIREGYVPNQLLPGDYGDYLALDINEEGVITNWKSNANLSNFESAEDVF